MLSAPACSASSAGVHRVRVRRAARLAHGGDVVDVDAQFDVFHESPRRTIERATVRVRSSRPSRQ
jgi:hypothetical protein